MFDSVFEQSLVFLPLVLGIYLSYKILRITDLTVDGSFVLGAAIYARLLDVGVNAGSALLLSLLGGFLSGISVALIQYKDKVNSLIAGILALFILYSINFQVLGRPNISLHSYDGYFNQYGREFIFISVSCVLVLMLLLLNSSVGLKLRAFGQNKALLEVIGAKPEVIRFFGLALSNSLAALCGVLSVEINGYADVNMGFGVTLTGIGSLVIGLEIMNHCYPPTNKTFCSIRDMVGCSLGVFIYFLALNTLLILGIEPINLKLCLGVVLIFFLRTAAQSNTSMMRY